MPFSTLVCTPASMVFYYTHSQLCSHLLSHAAALLLIVQYESHMAIFPDSPLPAVRVARGWPARLSIYCVCSE